MNRQTIKRVIPKDMWQILRRCEILRNHKRCARICEQHIDDYYACGHPEILKAKKELGTDKIIWQYWAQGYDNVPEIVRKCLESVDRFAGDYTVIRLSDENVDEYLDIPEFVKEKRKMFSTAHYSDLLRVMLLSVYGGLWLDATIYLSSDIPDYLKECDFFMYQRDPEEYDKKYWANSYAYYFGWAEGFRVNVLNSIIFAKKESIVMSAMCELLLNWWKKNDSIPDYFFFQILFDVLINGKLKGYNCPIVSDCGPHYLQQSINDPNFNLMDRETILATFPMHKLTYKK